MVENIPTADDFYQSGKELLNFSWDIVAKLFTALDEAELYGVEPKSISQQYWTSAKRNLSTALSIAQQGVEFVLKGRIADISPYLLIVDSPSKWPSPYKGSAIDFTMFRTLDAQDLIRVHDTFSSTPLVSDFVNKFNELRKIRNTLMHSIDKNLSIHVTEVIESILFMHKMLFPNESWPVQRLSFLHSAPEVELGSLDYATNNICWEISLVISMLKPAEVKEFFNVDKKQRKYICPICLSKANTDIDFEYKLAELRPKSAKSTSLFCPICNDSFSVEREKCSDSSCYGNVLSEGICLTCGH